MLHSREEFLLNRRGRSFTVVSFVTSFIVAGCGSSPDDSTASVDHWLGDTPHFSVVGTFDGHNFDVHLSGDAAIAAQLRCNRAYAPLPGVQPAADGTYDTSQLYFAMKQTRILVEFDGMPMEISTGYWGNDPGAGTDLEVIPRVLGASVPEGQTWVNFQVDQPRSELFSPPTKPVRAAESGTVSIKLNSGTPDQGGIYIPTGGRTGEFFSIVWGPQESLKISATVDCQESAVTPWAVNLIKP